MRIMTELSETFKRLESDSPREESVREDAYH